MPKIKPKKVLKKLARIAKSTPGLKTALKSDLRQILADVDKITLRGIREIKKVVKKFKK